MKYISTKNNEEKIMASEALRRGIAPDKGLYIPTELPDFSDRILPENFVDLAYEVIKPFFMNDVLAPRLKEICENAFTFDIPLVNLEKEAEVLELFHGPTAAFKDFGARFLAECLSQLQKIEQKEITILVATSGDTGGAVASAFYERPFTKVCVLFPQGRVSKRQEQQLTCWGKNIQSLAVKGSFDDCQDLVKAAFNDSNFNKSFLLSSANSINLGRLLPQMAYYHYAARNFIKKWNKKPIIIIPSGNLGNGLGAIWAMEMGAPIEKIILAVNENTTVPEYLESGEWKPRSSVQTLANAMDVGNPSNMERLRAQYPTIKKMKERISSFTVNDEQIKDTIRKTFQEHKKIICPHTAVAEFVRKQYFSKLPSIIVSTAHPAKFETIITPLIREEIEVPSSLKDVLERKNDFDIIENDLKTFYQAALKTGSDIPQ